ncbi:MAG: glycerophosphodiester phosphodiesterase [bacterium]
MEIIAHRGASAYAAENSLQSVELALQMNASSIEVDVVWSGDRKLLVHHDEQVKNVYNQIINFSDKNYSEIKNQVRLSNNETVPLLEDILNIINQRKKLYIEIKQYYIAGPLFKLLSDSNYLKNIEITSKLLGEVLYFRECNPLMPISLVVDEIEVFSVDTIMKTLKSANIKNASLNKKYITKEVVEKLKEIGCSVRVFTVNDISDAEYLINCGVDAIFTDKPDVMSRLGAHLTSAAT